MKRPDVLLSLLFFLMVVLFAPTTAFAGKVYKIVDKDGKVSYRQIGPKSTATVSPKRSAPRKPSPPPSIPAYKDRSYRLSTVDLYVTSWCGSCNKAIAFLRENNVSFNLYDIEKDKNAAKRYKALSSGRGVPLAVINGKKIRGFSEASYKRALNAE